MRAARFASLALLLLTSILATAAQAASLRVAPASVELAAGSKVALLTLRNDGAAAAHYQIRIFRWVQKNGGDRLEPTSDVVVSPPITKVVSGMDYLVRIVRLTRRPLAREESYRIIVDELPEPGRRRDGTVTFLVRYSVPVFFAGPDAAPAKLDWRVAREDGRLTLTAANPGGRRVRITNLRLRDRHWRSVTLAQGLTGYVLAGAARTWRFGRTRVRELAPGPARLRFETEREAADVPVALPGRR